MLSNYDEPFNDEKTEHFHNEYAKCRLSQLDQPIDSFVERQQLNDLLPIFPDTCGPSRLDTTIKSPVKDNSCLSTPNLFASSPDSGFPQSSPHTPLSFQSESPVRTSQPTTPSPLPRTSSFNPTNVPSTSTGTTPRSRTAGTLRNIPRDCYGTPYFYNFSHLLITLSLSLFNPKNLKKLAKSFQTNPMLFIAFVSFITSSI